MVSINPLLSKGQNQDGYIEELSTCFHLDTVPIVFFVLGDLVQSRDFHYTVEQPPIYRRPREVVAAYPSGGSRSRAESRADYAYVEHKSSPYHTGTLRTSVRGLSGQQVEEQQQRVRQE